MVWSLFQFFVVVLLLVPASACTSRNAPQEPVELKARVFLFQEQEKDIDPYPVRMLVTADFLRMDEGSANDDFLLFDRKKQVVFSVNRDTQSYYRFERRNVGRDGKRKPKLTVADNDVSDMPLFQGKKPRYRTYFANGDRCLDVVSAPGFDEDAVAAIRGYLNVMSDEHAATLDQTPRDMQADCMLADFVYAPVRHLNDGFPLREWDYRGYSRTLIDVGEETVRTSLFELPEGYQQANTVAGQE